MQIAFPNADESSFTNLIANDQAIIRLCDDYKSSPSRRPVDTVYHERCLLTKLYTVCMHAVITICTVSC